MKLGGRDFGLVRRKSAPLARRSGPAGKTVLMGAFFMLSAACRRAPDPTAIAAGSARPVHGEADAAAAAPAAARRSGPKWAAMALQVSIYNRPDASSKRLGYLRLGAQVERDPEPAGTAGCAKGWYRIYPKGYVCSGED